jgi:hypothetical protein
MKRNIRAKMTVESVVEEGTPKHREQVTLRAVYAGEKNAEDNTFASATPCASVEMSIDNPAAWGAFKEGQQFYVDFTPADPDPSE